MIHGNVYEFFRNKVLNSRGFFDLENPTPSRISLGAPSAGLLRRSHFLFASYEGRRIRQGISSNAVDVPSADERPSADHPFRIF